MSQWYESKREDLDLDGDEINIWIKQDDFGNVYTTVKIADIKDILKDELNKDKLTLISELREEMPKEEYPYFCGLNPETEEMEIIENADGLWGEDMSFARNKIIQEITSILNHKEQELK